MLSKIRDVVLYGVFIVIVVLLIILALGVKDFPLTYYALTVKEVPEGK